MIARDIIITLFFKHECSWIETYNAIKDKEEITEEDIDDCREVLDPSYITIVDEEYPEELKRLPKPPFVIKYEGNLETLKKGNFVFIDSDKTKLELPSSMTIKVRKINDVIIGDDLIITSLDNRGYQFAAALSTAIIKVSACYINYIPVALELGKDLFVEPTSKLNNRLIKDGAFLIDCIEDLEEFSSIKLK